MNSKRQKIRKIVSIFEKKVKAAIKKSKSLLQEEDLKDFIVSTTLISIKEAGIKENELDFNEILEAIRKSINQLEIQYLTRSPVKENERTNQIEKAANVLVEKLREYIEEEPIYDEEEFEALVFTTMIETITQTDPTENIQPNDIFIYAEKRIIELKLGQLKK